MKKTTIQFSEDVLSILEDMKKNSGSSYKFIIEKAVRELAIKESAGVSSTERQRRRDTPRS